jgi:hypothetical protein
MKTTPPPPRTAQDADKYIVRFPDGMRDQIAAAAKANNRSMNAEIVARLQQTFGITGVRARLLDLVASHLDEALASALKTVGVTPEVQAILDEEGPLLPVKPMEPETKRRATPSRSKKTARAKSGA